MSEVKKFGYVIPISREMAIESGLVEPTPEEAARIAESHRLYEIQRAKEAVILEAARLRLDTIREPGVRAVLDLHAPIGQGWDGDPECAHCLWDTEMGDHDRWPCETVTTIANVYGIELP